jgi:hypothetical protein
MPLAYCATTSAGSGHVLAAILHGEVAVLAVDVPAGGRQLAAVVAAAQLAQARDANQLGAVEAVRVVEHAAAVDDADRAVLGDQNLVRAEVAVGTAGLELGHLRLVRPSLASEPST